MLLVSVILKKLLREGGVSQRAGRTVGCFMGKKAYLFTRDNMFGFTPIFTAQNTRHCLPSQVAITLSSHSNDGCQRCQSDLVVVDLNLPSPTQSPSCPTVTTPEIHGEFSTLNTGNTFAVPDLVLSPYVILNDFGGAFAMGAIGGGIWHGIKGARNSPRVSGNKSPKYRRFS